MISITQCRMARAALGWNLKDLAERARVGSNTVTRFENGKPANPSTLLAIKIAFEAAGIEFTNDDAHGVRLKKKAAE